jgi:penicillin-binding protein 2
MLFLMFEQRSKIIGFVFVLAGIIFLVKLFYLQVIDQTYKDAAASNSLQRVLDYPYRGLIYDRKGRLLVNNIPVYDIMVTPRDVKKNMDTLNFCRLLNIEKEEVREKLLAARMYSRVKPSPFIRQISHTDLARIADRLIEYPGFSIEPRTVRGYDHNNLAHMLGYMAEISPEKLKKLGKGFYRPGDYIGISGLESQYEKYLRGKRGVKFVMVDVHGVQKGSFRGGVLDTAAIRGENLYTGIDLELQKLGERLMVNKKGAVICIDPKTGQVLSFVVAPSYDPNLLRGREFSKNYTMLFRDSMKPLFNRGLQAPYPPGSIFKTFQALVAQQEGVIDSNTSVPCSREIVNCHPHPNPCNLRTSIQWSCNPYYLNVYRRVINQNKSKNTFVDTRMGYETWRLYAEAFGFGGKLGIDVPNEVKGILKSPKYYNKIYGENHWKYSTIYSLSIGQGELGLTPLQMVNLACILANKGYYYTPHLVHGIGEKRLIIRKYLEKHVVPIDEKYFETILTGMRWAVQMGTVWSSARMKSVTICGKTGTAQNPHGKDHSIFIGFAPKENPRIAVACVVENSGFGGFVAAPIASLMIEQYLKDTVERKNLLEHMISRDFIHKAKPVPKEPEKAKPTAQVADSKPAKKEDEGSGNTN